MQAQDSPTEDDTPRHYDLHDVVDSSVSFDGELSDVVDGFDGEMTIMNDDDELSDEGEDAEEVLEHAIDFNVYRAKVIRTGIIPVCLFIGRVTWGTTEWNITFTQKQLVRLQISILWHLLWHRQGWSRQFFLPWTIWREKRSEKRVKDVGVVQEHIRTLLKDRMIRNSEALLSFLEVSPSRAMSRYGPSLKEGYVHMRVNGAFQLPLYSCFSRTVEHIYRLLYRTGMRVAFVSSVVGFIFPIVLVIVTNLPSLFRSEVTSVDEDGPSVRLDTSFVRILLGIASILGIIYVVAFVYQFFHHRLGVVRRWVVLKPSCFAAYRRRNDSEPSEVFLFDKSFQATKGSYRQGVSWMPSGVIVGSGAGFIEIDTGFYYMRTTVFAALIVVCYGVMKLSSYAYDFHTVSLASEYGRGVTLPEMPDFQPWQNVSNSSSVDQSHLCGFYFHVPDGSRVRVSRDTENIIVIQLQEPGNSTNLYVRNPAYFWNSDDVSDFNLLTTTIASAPVVGVLREWTEDVEYYDSGITYDVPGLGELKLQGIVGSEEGYYKTNKICSVPASIAPIDWQTVIKYILFLLAGGIVSPIIGLSVYYIATYGGIWHAQVRRDNWFRCVQRLQNLKRLESDYRYESFAPRRINTVEVDGAMNAAHASSHSNLSQIKDNQKVDEDDDQPIPSSLSTPCTVSWHVDAEDTYEAMYNAIKNAKYEVLIAGWWVCPDLYLKRPGRKFERKESDKDQTNETQLRNLLLAKAEEGVKIYVLIYREVKFVLTINSHYSKRSLMRHPNIRVLRDPIFQIQSLGFWSHHEKIVCIDQSLAFVGGLDLCFGRYDHGGHPINDDGGAKLENQIWPGKDYSNPVIKDFVRVNKPFEDLIDRSSAPRMPWHDVHSSVSGPVVQDLAFHFIQRWNFVCSKNDYQLRTGWCICCRSRRFVKLPKCIIPMDFNGWKLRYPTNQDASGKTLNALGDVTDSSSAQTHGDIRRPFPNTNLSTNSEGPVVQLQGDEIRDLSGFMPTNTAIDSASIDTNSLESGEVIRAQRGDSVLKVFHPNSMYVNCQALRSVAQWSAGVDRIERSIQNAYIDTILNARHYVYIENQFFISGTDDNTLVSNRILQALVDRIKQAVDNNQQFRVYILMPLMPAFEGNIRSEKLTNLHAVMHWQYTTISRGGMSLLEKVSDFTPEASRYVTFFGLRNYGLMPNGCMSTEQVYIHCKLLIADDRRIILGSANINDRSMNGDRDSEIALVLDDCLFEEGLMNDKPYRRGVSASKLRMQLMREHLGLSDDNQSIRDPTCEGTWQSILRIARNNTTAFEEVFQCAPSNKMRGFADFRDAEITQIYENQRLKVLKGPGGHAWDKDNLKEEDYAPWTDANGVPIPEDKVRFSEYVLDCVKDKKRKHIFSMDSDGWCYARNFATFQEVRAHDMGRREKLQHFMTDRLIAQVRRRRWVKKDSAAHEALMREIETPDSDDEQHQRQPSFWRRLKEGELSLPRSSSFAVPQGRRRNFSEHAGDMSNPSSPAASSFWKHSISPGHNPFRARGGPFAGARSMGNLDSALVAAAQEGVLDEEEEVDQVDRNMLRSSSGSFSKGVRQSMRKWHSFLDGSHDPSRRSKFKQEYLQDEERDEPLLESGRSSDEESKSGDENDGQIAHLQTAATLPSDFTKARGKLSTIRGHLVEFPVDFLVEEVLKPPQIPRDVYI